VASALERKQSIKNAFDRISEHWDRVRRHAWPNMIQFMNEFGFQEGSSTCLDIAAGNGRHTRYMAQFNALSIGIDLSLNLLKIAKEKHTQVNCEYVNADAANLPFRDGVFDRVMFISALHHLPNTGRSAALIELKRVMFPEALALITVWMRSLKRFAIFFLLDFLFLTFLKSSDKEFGDIHVPWRDEKKQVIASRFYHLFTKKELENDLLAAGFEIMESRKCAGKSGQENVFALVKLKKKLFKSK